MRRVILGIFTGAVILVLFVVLCTFVKRPYENVLLLRFGSLIEEKDQTRICYNWYLKFPTDSVERFDKRLHLYPGTLKEVPTAGSDIISVRAFAAWRIVDPAKFYRNTGGSDDRAQQMIDQIMQGQVSAKIARYHLDELFNADESKIKTSEIESDIAADATEDGPEYEKNADGSVKQNANGSPVIKRNPDGTPVVMRNADGTPVRPGLRSMGIQMAEVGFSRIAFAPSTANSVYERMVADLNKKATTYQTDGISQANIIRAKGRNDAEKERQDGLQKAAQIRGEGDALANQELAKVLKTQEARDFYQWWKSLDYLKAALAKNTVLILPSDGDILKALFQGPKGGPIPTALPANAADALKATGAGGGK